MPFQPLEQIRFLNPQVFFLLLLLPIVLFASWRQFSHLDKARQALGFPVSGNGSRCGRPVLVTLAYVLTLFCVLFALARPQLLRDRETEIVRKLDLVFLLDTSLSMNAQDILPSRLEKAREVIRNVVIGTPDLGRVGLVVFSGSSVILSYLTSDVSNILFYLDYLSRQPVEQLSTRIGPAIESGLKVLQEGRETQAVNPQNRGVLILISDGEDHGTKLSEALRQAQRSGLRIYTIGIGSEIGGFIRLQRAGGASEYLLSGQGARIVSRLNPGTLLKIAEITDGQFFRAHQGGQLETAFGEILKLEREVIGFRRQSDWAELYRPVLVAASLFLLVGLLLARQ